MIKQGDSPEQDNTYNKFISKSSEGQRGILLAKNDSGDEAIIIAVNSSFDPHGVKEGNMYLVKEVDPNQYPIQVKQVKHIPQEFTKIE